MYLRQSCSDGSRSMKPLLKPRVAIGGIFAYDIAAHTISEKAIRLWHPDYNPDQAQKLIRSSMSRHLSTRNISSKSMHAFLSNLAHRQTDKRTQAKTYTSSFVVGKNIGLWIRSSEATRIVRVPCWWSWASSQSSPSSSPPARCWQPAHLQTPSRASPPTGKYIKPQRWATVVFTAVYQLKKLPQQSL